MNKFSPAKLNELLNDPKVSAGGIMRLAGLSYTGFKKIREGVSVPSANTLAAIADALEKPVNYFFVEESNYSDISSKTSA